MSLNADSVPKCVTCDKRVLSHAKYLTCILCSSKCHITCLSVDKVCYEHLSKTGWFCPMCNQSIFPFNNANNEEEYKKSLSIFFEDCDWSNLDGISNLILNPFEINDSDKVPHAFDLDPDLNMFNELGYRLIENSNYFTYDTFNEFITNEPMSNDTLSFIHHNCRSLNRNFDEISQLLTSDLKHSFSVIGLSETHLNSSNFDLFNIDGYSYLSNYRTDRKGGGVSIYIKENFIMKERSDFNIMEEAVETIFIEIDKESLNTPKNVIVGVIYRPPSQNINRCIDLLSPILDRIKKEDKLCYLLGDYNINMFNIDTHEPTSSFTDLLFSHCFIPLINRPTRITESTATLIDNIFTNNLDDCFHSKQGLIISNITDHYPVFTILKKNIKHDTPTVILKRCFTAKNKERFNQLLNDVDWSNIYAKNDVHSAYSSFLNVFLEFYHTCFPMKSFKTNYSNKKPWLTDGLKKSIKVKNKLYFQMLNHPSNKELKDKYSIYKKLVRRLLEQERKQFYDDQFSQFRNDSRKSWNVIKSIINKKKKANVTSCSFLFNDEIITDEKEISNKFNDFFINVGPNLANSINHSSHSHKHYLKKTYTHSFFLKSISNNEVRKVISQLKNASPGYDEINADIVKCNNATLIGPLTHIFNLSFSSGEVPIQLKIANVIPLYKHDNPMFFTNYRPVSILPVFSKILERLMFNRLLEYLNKHNILHKLQFGFRPEHTTFDALIALVDYIVNAIEHGECVIGVFLDLSKAFDTVDHKILLDKLQYYGVRGTQLNWFSNYLSDRQQFTTFNNVTSCYKNIKCGVPQGSILGPLLFLIYLNDIALISENVFTINFADDTSVFIKGNNLHEMSMKMNDNLRQITEWLQTNKLSLNIKKSNFMIFKPKRTCNTPVDIVMNNQRIEQVHSTKFLGVVLDCNLSWKNHIDYISKKVAKGIGVLSKCSKYLNLNTKRTLYYSFIFPHLIYCNHVWGNTFSSHLYRLEILQKKAIRIVCAAPYLSHTSELFRKMSVLKIKEIHFYVVSIIMYKFVSKRSLPMYNNMFIFNSEIHNVNTRSLNKLHLPRVTTTLSKRFIKYHGSLIWNNISKYTNNVSNVYQFKKCIKKLIIENANMMHLVP